MSKMIELEYTSDDFDDREELEIEKNKKETKGKITSERVKAQGGGFVKGLHKQMRDGKCIGYIADFCYGYHWELNELTGEQIKKQDKQRKSFSNKKAAEKWLKEQAALKAQMEEKGKKLEKDGYTVSDICDLFHDQLVADGKSKNYINDHDTRMRRFRKFFTREDNKYVKKIDTAQIQEYLDFEAHRKLQNGKVGMCETSVMKYKSTLNMMWEFMLRNRYKYQVFENIVEPAKVKARPSEFESVALYYYEIEELIDCVCNYFDDPSYLFILVFAYLQGFRRGEICGLKWGDIDFEKNIINVVHNRVQVNKSADDGVKNTDDDDVKLPKTEKKRHVELHNATLETLQVYKLWQEEKLGRPVNDDEFVLMFEINLKYNYLPSCGKISRKWGEMYKKINKMRAKARKDEIRYARLHDGRETYATLLLHGVKKQDDTIITAADNRQVYESMGHSLPSALLNTTETTYSKYTTDRWDVTRFWNELIDISVKDTWNFHEEIRKMEWEMMSEVERLEQQQKKQKKFDKAIKEKTEAERQDILIEYE